MKILKISQFLIALLAGSLIFSASRAQSADSVAKVNGVVISQAKIDQLVRMQTAQGQPDSPELRNRIRDILINQEMIAQEAVKKGLDKNPEVSLQIEMGKQQVLINAYMQDYIKANPINDESMRKEYDAAKSQAGDKEYKARHILVKSEDEAKQIIAQLKKGGSFEKLAAQKSEDSGSKEKGGDLDWAPPTRYVPPFGEALRKLKKGQMTDAPVQSPFGWHVIRLDDERPIKLPAFEEVKGTIQQQLQQRAVQKATAELRAKAKIE